MLLTPWAIEATGVGLPCWSKSISTVLVSPTERQLIETCWPISNFSSPTGAKTCTSCAGLRLACGVLPS